MLDLVNPDEATLRAAVDEVEKLRAAHGSVFIHCALGLSRSALVAAAWLLQRDPQLTVEHAVAKVRQARPQVVFSADHLELLKRWNR